MLKIVGEGKVYFKFFQIWDPHATQRRNNRVNIKSPLFLAKFRGGS